MEHSFIELATKEDERGFVIRPFEGKELHSIHNIHLVSLNPGAVRGNHFHPTQREYILVLGTHVKLVMVDNLTDTRSEKIIDEKGSSLVMIPPKVAHAIKNLSNETIYLLCYTDKPFTTEKDVVKKVVLT